MGHLHYGYESDPLIIPDRVLAHLRVVATTKLRRQESFPLTWVHPDGAEGGRTTLWMHAAIPMRFVFDGAEPEDIDRELLQLLGDEANSANGIVIDGREGSSMVGIPTPEPVAA